MGVCVGVRACVRELGGWIHIGTYRDLFSFRKDHTHFVIVSNIQTIWRSGQAMV